MNLFFRLNVMAAIMVLSAANVMAYDIRNGVTLELRSLSKLFSVHPLPIDLWVYCLAGVPLGTPGECAAPTFPSPLLELGVGLTATVTLDITNPLTVALIPSESPGAVTNFYGHTIHFANLDLPAIHDGVPAPFPPVSGTPPTNTAGHDYLIDLATNIGHIGGHAYYCHVHQTKHLEMGEFGALIVRPITAGGVFIPTINLIGPSYDVEANLILNTIDLAYHSAEIVGDDTVFSTYDPVIFLVNGNEGLAANTPAVAINALVNQTVAIRLIGMHGVNATFQIVDNVLGNVLGTAQNFVLHNVDGQAQTATTLASIELSPGQTKDVLVTMPATATTWYPVVTYKHLRNDSVLADVFNTITIQ